MYGNRHLYCIRTLPKKSNIFYTGFTSNLIKRFHDHNSFNLTGFTVKHRPWIVFYTEINIYPEKKS
ncbi:MAG: GIY-YIG nuclease family protein [Saprospiraceae bacterium]|nr:GIY-YIG nuclease family protein [Saprospiraceae bacterium]MBP6569067.1 GIY-YIG nuclease family protein [Saprospiraceae bacterium]